MLVFNNTPCKACYKSAGYYRLKRTCIQRHVTHRNQLKVKCAYCGAMRFLGREWPVDVERPALLAEQLERI